MKLLTGTLLEFKGKKKLIEKNHHEWEKNVGTTNKAYCVVKCNAL
jgi:hypothetical protein